MRHSIKSFFQVKYLCSLVMLMNSCAVQEIQVRSPITINENVERLSEAVASRDIESLWVFKDDTDGFISGTAWRALAVTQIDDRRELLDFALETGKKESWYALRFQELTEPEIEEISIHFFTSDHNRSSICELLFLHGDRWTLDMMLNDSGLVLGYPKCAMAVGGMMTRIDAGSTNIKKVTELLFETEDEVVLSNLLYGFWRSSLNRPAVDSEPFKNLLRSLEDRRDNQPALVDEFLIRLTNEKGFDSVMNSRSDRELSENIQLSVELARSARYLNEEELNKGTLMRLLNHTNPHVSIMALESLLEIDGLDSNWLQGLADELTHFPSNTEVAVTYLDLLQKNGVDLQNMISILESVDQSNPYLKNRTLLLFNELLNREVYLEKIRDNMKKEGIEAYHGAIALTEIAVNYFDQSDIRDEARKLLIEALESQNRSALTVSGQLLTNRTLFNEEDKELFMASYERAVNQNDPATAQLIAGVMSELGMVEEGISMVVPLKEIRKPDWNRLVEIGESPRWVLETNRGEIVILLDPFSAPFTVSSIDSLTRSGLYDGVVFHRVVRNFVIQGGDFDRKDGLGGPDYRIPTEPAFTTFKRGSVGMASSGQDTEGSQFFITHTWTPHLDGLYTIFGEVIEGMDVVDRIQIGDVVVHAKIFW